MRRLFPCLALSLMALAAVEAAVSGPAAFHLPVGGLKPVPPPTATTRVPSPSSSSSSSLLTLGATEGTNGESVGIGQQQQQQQQQRRRTRGVVWSGLFRRGEQASSSSLAVTRSGTVRPLLASLSPEQEAKRYQLRRQVEDLDDLIRSKTDSKRAMEKEIEALLSQKRGLQMEVNTMAPSLEIASESPLRSLVKACSWRFIAALITLSTSLFFSRDAKMAASIVSSDFLSKAGTMYAGERLWNKVSWGKKAKAGDAASRSIIKAFAWRAFAMVNTLVISIFFAKSVKIAGQIASTDTIIKTSLYVVHERIWAKINWGRSYDVEYNI